MGYRCFDPRRIVEGKEECPQERGADQVSSRVAFRRSRPHPPQSPEQDSSRQAWTVLFRLTWPETEEKAGGMGGSRSHFKLQRKLFN